MADVDEAGKQYATTVRTGHGVEASQCHGSRCLGWPRTR
jgi:hypothetical protein